MWKDRSKLHTAATICLILAVSSCGGKTPLLRPPLTSGKGVWGACPPKTAKETQEQKTQGLGVSPQLTSRFLQRYPPGSAEETLINDLTAQGFKLTGSCSNDSSTRTATFNGYAGGIFNTFAAIFWRVDKAGAIIWTKGFAGFDGF